MEENLSETQAQATIPEAPQTHEDFNLSVRFNKEDVNLDYDSAVRLTQKGMKFELIEDDYIKVRELAKKEGKTLSQYVKTLEENHIADRKNRLLDLCGGNVALCDKIIELEDAKQTENGADLSEIRENFPEIDSIEKLPEQVKENCELKGTNLLDEYLRYLLKQSKLKAQTQLDMQNATNSSVGSQNTGAASFCDCAGDEFIKGIWSRN